MTDLPGAAHATDTRLQTILKAVVLGARVPDPASTTPDRRVPLLPENIGAMKDRTVALLTKPKNVHVGIWRQIRLESFRDVSAGVLRVVATMRFDAKYADELGVSKLINLKN